MSAELEAYRRCVLDALGRMAAIEERLRVEADEGGEETLSLVHEHGAMVLREAQNAVRRTGRE